MPELNGEKIREINLRKSQKIAMLRVSNVSTILVLTCVLLITLLRGSASAFCEQPPAKLCNVFFSNDLVVHAKVLKTGYTRDKPDIDYYVYHLEVLKVYRGKIGKSVTVYTENSTGRLSLKPGNEYIVFAFRNQNGDYEVNNYCGEVQHFEGEPYSARLEEQIRELKSRQSCVIEGEVVDKNWNLISGAKLTIVGNNMLRDITVDKKGLFNITVPPGNYQVLIPENLHVTDYSWSVADKNPDKVRPLSLVSGQCVQIQLQER
ncbi:MAG TPA: hypothetical protein VMT62_07065 [Syntrophorhabdaceae bacterium]|nr:hypothetical protein [Syntrophorhabdaceae bacterium]